MSGPANTTGAQPINPLRSTGVDLAGDMFNYKQGLSSAYSLYNASEARHVDVRPKQQFFDQATSRSQLRPLKWDQDAARNAASEFTVNYQPEDISDPEIRLHVSLCYERMQFFQKHYGPLPWSPELFTLKTLALGPSFNDQYASWWKDSRFEWADTERITPIDSSAIPFKFESYNTTYPPFFLIFWGEEPEDYKWMLGPDPPEPNPDTLAQIELRAQYYADTYMKEKDFITPPSIIYSPTSSNAFDGVDTKKPEWEFEYESPDDDYMDTHLVFLRGFAHKRPTESRDIGLMTPQSLRLHRKLMYPLQRCCRRIPKCVYGKDQKFIRSVVSELGNNNRYFYMRDYTKSGMTIPHEVVCAVFRGFYHRQPALKDAAIKAFSNARVAIQEGQVWEYFRPTTGYPLGMFVEGYTLLQYIMNDLITMQIGKKVSFNGNNDDMIVGSISLSTVEAYLTADRELQSELGMSVKGSKTGISNDHFIYCEEYWNGDVIESKEVLYTLGLIGAKYAINIVHAKELVCSLITACGSFSKNLMAAINIVQSSYIPEFSEQEIRWPYLFGGWFPTYYKGCDSSILWRNGDYIADCAYWATQARPHQSNELKDTPTLSLGRYYNASLIQRPSEPVALMSLKPFFGTKKCLKDYYASVSRSARDIKRYYHKWYLVRRSTFRSFTTGRADCPSVTKGYIRRHPNTVVIPGMEGVSYSTDGFVARNPSIGVSIDSLEAALRSLVNQGYIDCKLPSAISNSEKILHSQGIFSELDYPSLPIAKGGAPLFSLSNKLPGLEYLYTTHKLFVRTVDDSDQQVSITESWDYAPFPLALLIRMRTTWRKYPAVPVLSPDTALWWFKAITGQARRELDDLEWDRPEQDSQQLPISERDDQFEEYLKKLLSDVCSKLPQFTVAKDRVYDPLAPDKYKSTTVIDGVTYVETGVGSWVPESNPADSSLSFWEQEDDDDFTASLLFS